MEGPGGFNPLKTGPNIEALGLGLKQSEASATVVLGRHLDQLVSVENADRQRGDFLERTSEYHGYGRTPV